MNDKQYEAFQRTAKRIKDASRGKLTMDEARRELAKHLTRNDNGQK